jgi:hypothetical protein
MQLRTASVPAPGGFEPRNLKLNRSRLAHYVLSTREHLRFDLQPKNQRRSGWLAGKCSPVPIFLSGLSSLNLTANFAR